MSEGTIRLGILRLLDCAAPIIAQERGLFAAAGLDVAVVTEPSWANIADKLAYGQLDAALILGPLALAMMLGLRGRSTDLRAAALVSREGNAVVLAPARVQREEKPRFAVVHAYSSHDLLLRDFLVGQGVRPGRDAAIIVLPPAEMPAALAAGTIDGFCAGAPWGAVAEATGAGRIVATSRTLAPRHAEKFLVLRGNLADQAPRLGARLRAALGEANARLTAGPEQENLARLLSAPGWLGLAPEILVRALRRESPGPLFMTGQDLTPHAADAAWPFAMMRRHGLLNGVDEEDVAEAIGRFVGTLARAG
ncbi:MAG TPA: ABC transporter substrate-binding protein [Acetobacteraceae bacterium]|nr:ABC transporter substrate-binding protein [Acetobacteraceae bacterium]